MAGARELEKAEKPQVEITDDMIAAGVGALPFIESSALGSLSEETVVSRVFQAMHAASLRRP